MQGLDRPPTIVGIGGSLGPHSTSLAALQAVLAKLERVGATTRLFDVRTLGLPFYDPSVRDIPKAARDLAAAAHGADALVWSSPMYHGSISGAFKNALDWLQLLADASPPFLANKPVGLIATAGGAQGLQAINTMEFVVRALRGWTVPLVVPIARSGEAFAPGGTIRDVGVAQQLDRLATETLAAACQFSVPTLDLRIRMEA